MPVLGTKLHVPSRRHELVPRGRLVDRLAIGQAAPRLVLIAAPAGFGNRHAPAQEPKRLAIKAGRAEIRAEAVAGVRPTTQVPGSS
jgi:ATP/maltotriose-dependent transcriptional regulator MalT